MKLLLITIVTVLLLPSPLRSGEKVSPPLNKHVKFSAAVKEKKLKPGSTATLLFSLTPDKGIHINLDPPVSFQLDTTLVGFAPGSIDLPKKKTFLDASKPIRQSILLAKMLKVGDSIIRGTLTYYYCSDAEGWCSRFKQPVELKLTIAQ